MSKAVRTTTAIVLALAAIGLSGCARSSSAEAAGCAPRAPHVSEAVARPGTSVTISVSAAICRPRFDHHDRRLSLVWQDRTGHRRRLATVTAFPSGAFERTVTIPAKAVPGDAQVHVEGFRSSCGDTGSCAASEVGLDVVTSTPVFTTSQNANRVAADVATALQASLQHRRSFVQVGIVPDGVEVVLDSTTYDRETAAAAHAFTLARRAVPTAERSIARRTHLHTRFIHHSEAGLEHLTLHIAHDGTWQKAHGIELSEWSPDSATDSVRIALRHYTDAQAVRLTERYGDVVTVSTKDTPFAIAA